MVKMLRIPVAALILFLIIGGTASAQNVDCRNEGFVDCDAVGKTPNDTARIVSIEGRPGDTAWIPFYLGHPNDTVSAFTLIFEYDDSYLSPVIIDTVIFGNDTAYYTDFELAGALLEGQQGLPGSDPFYAVLNPGDSGAVSANFAPEPPQGGETEMVRLLPGGGVYFRLPFVVDPAMPDGSTAQFTWYEYQPHYGFEPSTQTYICTDCRLSNLSVDITDTIEYCSDTLWLLDTIIDTVDVGPPPVLDTSYVQTGDWECLQYSDSVDTDNKTRYPTAVAGQFRANLSPPPVIGSFGIADADDSVGTNDGIVLEWSVSNTDSIVIFQGANLVHTSTDPDAFHSTNAPSSEGTYTYTLWAYNAYDSLSTSVDLLVQDGGQPPDENAPVINVSTFFSIDVGNTLNFTVNATDPDNDFLTLTATNLPAGATFPDAQGTGSASSSFSWTPGLSQTGSHTATFRAEDATARVTTVNVTINVNEPQFDKLFTSSVEGSASGGLPGKTNIEFPINLVTSQTVYGVQFDFLYDDQNFDVTGVDVTDNTAEYVVYENIGETPGEVRFVTFGMANEPIGTDGTDILLVEMAVESDASPGLYPVYLEDAWESVNPDPSIPSLPLVSDTGVIMVDAYGDVNLDTRVDIADLVSIVGYIIGDFPLDTRRYEIADVVIDATVDVFDLVAVVNVIYGAPVNPAPPQYLEDRFASVELEYDNLVGGRSDEMIVRSEMPVDIAGVQLEILYDPAIVELGVPQLTRDVDHLALRSSDDGNGKMTILMYSTNPFATDEVIRAGRSDLVSVPINALRPLNVDDRSQLVLNQAKLATERAKAVKVHGMDAPLPTNFHLAQNYPNPFNPTTTIEFTIGAPGQTGSHRVNLNVYNVLGQQVKELISRTLPAGNHQVTWDGTDGSGKRVASGVYLYKLQVGDASQSKKMLLLK